MTQARANRFERFDPNAPADAAGATTAPSTRTEEPPVVAQVATAVLKELLYSVVASKAGFAIGRSAMFLISFLMIHLVGNLSLFKSPQAFNDYCYFLNTPPVGYAIKVIEYYLLLAFISHAVSASMLTYKFNKLKPSKKDPLCVMPLLCGSHCRPNPHWPWWI